MTDQAEPPRRRRRASRRAAGPPASVSTPPTADLVEDPPGTDSSPEGGSAGPAPRAVVGPDAAPIGLAPDAAGTVLDVAGAASEAAGSGHVHGSPAGAPGHQPSPGPSHGHGPSPAESHVTHDHSPTQSSTAATRERPGEHQPAGAEPSRRSGRSPREEASERSLRSLVTTRSTQVSPTAALRAREVGLPSTADLLAAEAELVIVRRHYVPPTTLSAGRRQDWPNRRGSAGQGSTG